MRAVDLPLVLEELEDHGRGAEAVAGELLEHGSDGALGLALGGAAAGQLGEDRGADVGVVAVARLGADQPDEPGRPLALSGGGLGDGQVHELLAGPVAQLRRAARVADPAGELRQIQIRLHLVDAHRRLLPDQRHERVGVHRGPRRGRVPGVGLGVRGLVAGGRRGRGGGGARPTTAEEREQECDSQSAGGVHGGGIQAQEERSGNPRSDDSDSIGGDRTASGAID